jgi:beta-phosphoglucomutase-like phosphatase (HAD superfamily)
VLIVFDLDGTLIDSSKDLAIAMNATREHLGMPPVDPSLIYSYVGNGVRVLVERALGSEASKALVDKGHQFFLAYYGAHAVENTRLYPGVEETLERLNAKHKLAILTNKPIEISYRIVKFLQIEKSFGEEDEPGGYSCVDARIQSPSAPRPDGGGQQRGRGDRPQCQRKKLWSIVGISTGVAEKEPARPPYL